MTTSDHDHSQHIELNQPYPFELPEEQGAIADFLSPYGNELLISIPDISSDEALILQEGDMMGGFLAQNGAILFFWQFLNGDEAVITLDSPFDAREIPDIQLEILDEESTDLVIDIHVIDATTKIVKALRSVSFPPELTLKFLAAAKNQLANSQLGEIQQTTWMNADLMDLVSLVQMSPLNSEDDEA
jgi:hypothetical protein